tara:strand:- start:255 stop:659 length:405 start_codon:yes stop_codon:yes gene_type:complete
MNNKKFQLDIITPNGSRILGAVDYLRAPSLDGLFGVMAKHIPAIIAINPGEVKIVVDGKETFYATSGGYADIKKEGVMLVLETAERGDEIDIDRANQSIERATKYLKDKTKDIERSKLSIEKAKVRISIAKKLN